MAADLQPRFLLVHEEAAFNQDYQNFFKQNGWNCKVASDFESAVKEACCSDYEIVITDLDLLGSDSTAFMDKIRLQKPNQAFMVVCSQNQAASGIKALRSGALDFIQKPLDLRFLHETISRIVATLREEEAQLKLLRRLSNYEAQYKFSTMDLVSVPFVPPILNELQRGGVIDLNTKLKISLAFQEALTNCVEHGNLELESSWKEDFDASGNDKFTMLKEKRLFDPKFSERPVVVDCSIYNKELTFKIEDCGPGFEFPEASKFSVVDEASLLCYGRGLRIIYGTMDRVRYENGGRIVTLIKSL